jgi:hypothetical protein
LEDNIKKDSILLFQDRNQWWPLLNIAVYQCVL